MELNVHQHRNSQKPTASMHHLLPDGSCSVYVLISKAVHVSYFTGSPQRQVRFVSTMVLYPTNLTIKNYYPIG